MGGEHVILIHMVDSVMYNLAIILAQKRAAIRNNHTTTWTTFVHPYSLQVFTNLQSMTNGNSGITQTYPGAARTRINTYFPQQKSKLEATCAF